MAAYREPDRSGGKRMMSLLMTELRGVVPKKFSELTALGKTLKKQAAIL